MTKKNLVATQVADEQLADVVGGARILAARANAEEQEVVEANDDDEVDLLSPAFTIRCPLCGHSLACCTCRP